MCGCVEAFTTKDAECFGESDGSLWEIMISEIIFYKIIMVTRYGNTIFKLKHKNRLFLGFFKLNILPPNEILVPG